jgi:hypothetical protein
MKNIYIYIYSKNYLSYKFNIFAWNFFAIIAWSRYWSWICYRSLSCVIVWLVILGLMWNLSRGLSFLCALWLHRSSIRFSDKISWMPVLVENRHINAPLLRLKSKRQLSLIFARPSLLIFVSDNKSVKLLAIIPYLP